MSCGEEAWCGEETSLKAHPMVARHPWCRPSGAGEIKIGWTRKGFSEGRLVLPTPTLVALEGGTSVCNNLCNNRSTSDVTRSQLTNSGAQLLLGES